MLMDNKRGKERTSRAAQEAQRRREEREKEVQAEKLRVKRAKEREKQARKERNSRAAQTAQRQREERKEDTRLDGLRQKQKKEARQRTKKRISPVFWRRLFIMLGVVLTVILTMVIFFRVEHIEVEGCSYYTPQEISAICGVDPGDNLLTISRSEIAGNIFAQKSYVKDVQVTRRLPNTVKITVTEYPAAYAVSDPTGNYYLVASDGVATELISEKEAKEHILITGLQIAPTVLGEVVTVAPEEGQEGAETGKLRAMIQLLEALERAELAKEIAVVHIPTARNITIWYEDRFAVSLGSTDRIDYKLEYLKLAVAAQKDYATGSIDLTLSYENAAIVKLDD